MLVPKPAPRISPMGKNPIIDVNKLLMPNMVPKSANQVVIGTYLVEIFEKQQNARHLRCESGIIAKSTGQVPAGFTRL